MVDATPKYHAELASEGIEYRWGYLKGLYCHALLPNKKGQQNFFDLVEQCCSPILHLTKERVRKMALRARLYNCTYHYLAQEDNQQVADADLQQPLNENLLAQQQKLLFVNIEKLTKEFWSHCCALDFDDNFVTSLLKTKICNDDVAMEPVRTV